MVKKLCLLSLLGKVVTYTCLSIVNTSEGFGESFDKYIKEVTRVKVLQILQLLPLLTERGSFCFSQAFSS